jgi:hypothetical protein
MLKQNIDTILGYKFLAQVKHQARKNIFHNFKFAFIFQKLMCLTYACCLLHLKTFFMMTQTLTLLHKICEVQFSYDELRNILVQVLRHLFKITTNN